MESQENFELSKDELAAQQGREGNHPFELGRQAANDGLTLEANPFPRRSADALAFKRGWSAVIAEKTAGNGAAQKEEPAQEEAPAGGKYKTQAKHVGAVQPDLPGTEEGKAKFDEAVDLAARQYAVARDNRMAATEEEVKAKTFLIELLQKKEMSNYRYEDVEVELVPSDVKLKVRIKKKDDEE